MKKIFKGERFIIHSYKHDGSIHRAWDEAVLLEESDDYLVFGNERTRVIESDGRTWKTKEPAILFFYKDSWFNVIGQCKKDGIYYYCNIASPFIIEDHTIKYIDYDLDLRIFPSLEYKVLDRMEYKYHKKIMNYSSDLDIAIKNGLNELLNEYKNGAVYFNKDVNQKYCYKYMELKDKKSSKVCEKNEYNTIVNEKK